MVLVFIVLTMRPALGRRLPPLIGALLVGAVASVLLGRFNSHALESLQLVQPVLQLPQWSWAAMVELVVPLTISATKPTARKR
jgi:benzoate membrane transport protein